MSRYATHMKVGIATLIFFFSVAVYAIPVTFQADISDLLTEGFTSGTHALQIQGDFTGWSAGLTLEPVAGEENIYAVTADLSGSPGDLLNWKFMVTPGDAFLDGGWELGTNHELAVPSESTVLEVEIPNIYQGVKTISEARSLGVNRVVRCAGIVTAPNYGVGYAEYIVQDETAGIVLYYGGSDFAITQGNRIEITGRISDYNGKMEIIPEISSMYDISEAIVLLDENGVLPEPQTITIADLLADAESYESELVLINAVSIVSGTWPAEGSNSNLIINESGGAELTLRIDQETDIDGTTQPAGEFDLIGVIGQFDNTAPYDEGYQILPRSTADIITGSSGDYVLPLLETEWDTYTWPYNAYYPENPNGINGHIGNACGPTAIAHILKYWEYPEHGNGTISFIDNARTLWEADYENTNYNWANMPNYLPWEADESQYTDVATLMLHTAVAMQDYWGSGLSLAELCSIFQTRWNYSVDAYVAFRDDYTPEQWDQLFRNELDNGRPILVEGWTENSTPPGQIGNHEGHYFLVDGYNAQGQYHIKYNFGDYDGYYDLYNLGSYNAWNWIIVGLEPGETTVAQHNITFQIDATALLAAGFDPGTHSLELWGSFNGWENGETFDQSVDPSLFTLTRTFLESAGDSIEWKVRAAPTDQFLNNGWEVGESRKFALPETDITLSPVQPVIQLAGGSSQAVTVRFSVDVTDAANYQNDQTFTNIRSVFINGDFATTSGWAGWSVADTSQMFRMHNDGATDGDAVAGDNIWTGEVTFASGSLLGHDYKYSIYDPDNLDMTNESPMNNEAGADENHTFTIQDESASQILATDVWQTLNGDQHFQPAYRGNPYLAMNIYVTAATFDDADVQIGDEIGIFDGDLCVGFATVDRQFTDTDPLAIVASTDDPTTTGLDGFTIGNSIAFRLWKASESQEYSGGNPAYVTGDGVFHSQGTAVVSLAFSAEIEQTISMQAGWNILSLSVTPPQTDMLELLQPLIDAEALVKVQNEAGAAVEHLPMGWINNIGDWASTEGYYVKTDTESELVIQGNEISLPENISLLSGWNIMSYPVMASQSAMDILQPLIDGEVLVKVQDETGAAVEELPFGWVNNIGDFESGKGYYIKVTSETAVTIQSPQNKTDTPASVVANSTHAPEHFSRKENGNPYNPMNIYCLLDDSREMQAGWEVAAFSNNLCVGSTVVTQESRNAGYLQIIAAMDDPTTEFADGFIPESQIVLHLWDGNSEYLLQTKTVSGSDLIYESRGTVVVNPTFWSPTGIDAPAEIPTAFQLYQAYPNPFNPTTTIRYGLPEPSYVTINIYDLRGQLVKRLVDDRRSAGFYSVTWDGTNIRNEQTATGVYFYQMIAGKHRFNQKVVYVK